MGGDAKFIHVVSWVSWHRHVAWAGKTMPRPRGKLITTTADRDDQRSHLRFIMLKWECVELCWGFAKGSKFLPF